MKVINDLLGYKNLKIVQNTNYFSFSLDSVLLANFINYNKKIHNILDIGTGNAPIPLIISSKVDNNVNIYGIELQIEIYNMAKESLKLNNLESKIKIINDDIKNIYNYFDMEYFDIIVSNPPYFKTNKNSKKNNEKIKSIARHEIKLTLDELLNISFKYLKNNGKFLMVHRTERLEEILEKMHKNKIEPKRIMFLFPKKNASSNLFLVEGVKNGNVGLREVEHLIVHKSDGKYSEEVLKYFKD
ncbi:MAG: tRNA1(Val) (adenine(37)-N6)-methyltransferase [bacterium]|nr:tRNA1(Val) (adenine(37)-N6)-methyltransferase [bacterium]